MENMINLSKSKYTRGLQCPKILWMDKYMPEKAEQENLESVFETGNKVVDLARRYFGDYVLIDFDKGIQAMIDDTKQCVEAGVENIAEGSDASVQQETLLLRRNAGIIFH